MAENLRGLRTVQPFCFEITSQAYVIFAQCPLLEG